jgi:hypothetical protein
MSAAVVVLSDSGASAAAVVLPVPADLRGPAAVPVPVPREPELLVPVVPVPVAHKPQPPAPRVLVQVPRGRLLNLLSSPLPRVVVESEVRVHRQGRRSFSAVTARNSRLTGKPTY